MPCAFHLERPLPFQDLGPGCQFNVAEIELIKLYPKEWCPFHLPMESADGAPSPKADWNQKKVQEFNTYIFAFIENSNAENRPADLSGIIFPGNLSFEPLGQGYSLPSISFKNCEFHGSCELSSVKFGMFSDFSGVVFEKLADFQSSSFEQATFIESIFKSGAMFFNASFNYDALFSGVHFLDDAYFDQGCFRSDTSFEAVTFDIRASFCNTAFLGVTLFYGSQFEGPAYFTDATFNNFTTFSHVCFKKNAGFQAFPVSDNPHGDNQLRSVPCDTFQIVHFDETIFNENAVFTNRRFLAKTTFVNTAFHVAPDFHNCVLHQDTDFTDAKFPDRSGAAAPAYRTLKLAMGRVRAVDEEAMFYALEMESRRKLEDTPLSVKVFSRLYKTTADYGRSFMRPFYWLLGFWGVFCLIYLAAFAPGIYLEVWDGVVNWGVLADVAQFTVEQTVRPFSAFTLTEGVTVGSESVEVSFGLACLAAIQSILSLGFIALFILAIRRRFRMG